MTASLRNLNVFYFLIYSMLGWFFEIIYCLAVDGTFANRGMSNGPYLPIYGFGAIIIINLIAPHCKSVISLFFSSAIICTALEYLTSWYLEATFKISLWDYSSYPLNINGRVCLWNSVLFGLLAILVIRYFQPLLNKYLTKIPERIRPTLSILIVVIVLTDFLSVAFPLQQLTKTATKLMVLFS